LEVIALTEVTAMRPYSMDLRRRVLEDCDAGLGTAQVAAKFRVSAAWARRLKQRRRQTGETAPRPQRHGPAPSWAAHADAVRASVRDDPDATLAERRAKLAAAFSRSALARALRALGLGREKKRSGPPSRTAPT
jgi:transposase